MTTPLLINAADNLREKLAGMAFPAPVQATYNPLEYAWERHCDYLERCGTGRKKVLFLGMNPGPWGMAQTGVPFGEIPAVRDWMGIHGPVGKPVREHPKRPIMGFECEKSEVSGRRLWGMFAERYPKAPDFFKDHFVANYCPLVWMSETGANITPDKLPKTVMAPVEEACFEHLQTIIQILEPEHLVGVGAYAEKKLTLVAQKMEQSFHIGKILHPSPASPAANKGWPHKAIEQMEALGLW